jgi:hypothetical protein
MDNKKIKGKMFTRRGILGALGGGIMIPFLASFQSQIEVDALENEEEQYKTLLKPDGTVVKVKISALKNAKIVRKNISNKSFLGWLNKNK